MKFAEFVLFAVALFISFAMGLYSGNIDHEKIRDRWHECQKDLNVLQYGEKIE